MEVAVNGIPLITAAQASTLLGVSIPRTYELIRTAVLPPGVVVRLGRQIRIDRAQLDAWLRHGGNGSTNSDGVGCGIPHEAASPLAVAVDLNPM